MSDLLTWDKIALMDVYRNAPEEKKNAVRKAWFADTAPYLYPQQFKTFEGRLAVSQMMRGTELPAMMPTEHLILRSDRMKAANIGMVENDPEFRKLPYAQQQQLRHNWFIRMSREFDPEFAKLPQEEQSKFYENLMKRSPSYGMIQNLLIQPENPEAVVEDKNTLSRASNKALTATQNFINSLLKWTAWPFAAVSKLTRGTNGVMYQTFQDVEKATQFAEAQIPDMTAGERFLTKGLPTFAGALASFLIPVKGVGALKGMKGAAAPLSMMENALAGWTGVGVKKLVEKTPGLIEKAVRGIGIKAGAPILYQTIGAALAGTINDIGMNVAQNKPWYQGLALGAATGVATEFLQRYIGMMLTLRRVARSAGLGDAKIRSLLTTPFDAKKLDALGTEFAGIMKEQAWVADVLKKTLLTDDKGILYTELERPEGLRLVASTLGLDIDITPDKVIIKKGSDVLAEKTGQNMMKDALTWMETTPNVFDAWLENQGKKGLAELIQTAPSGIQLRIGAKVPVRARQMLYDVFKNMGVPGYFENWAKIKDDPNFANYLDEIIGVLRSNVSNKKAAQILLARGYNFAADFTNDVYPDLDEFQEAVTKDLRQMLESAYPTKPFQHGLRIEKVLPEAALEEFKQADHAAVKDVITGNGRQVVNWLLDLKRKESALKAVMTKKAAERGITLERYIDTNVVEMSVPISKESVALIHFSSYKQAVAYLTKGKSVKDQTVKVIAGIWDDNPQLKKSYVAWMRGMRQAMGQDYVDRHWMPFAYMQAQAMQEKFQLGFLNGKYILQDLADELPLDKSVQFNTLDEVAAYLAKNDVRQVLPNLGVPATEGVETVLKDKASRLPFMPIKTKQYPGVGYMAGITMGPTYNAIRKLQQLPEAAELAKKGVDPMQFYWGIHMASREQAAFMNTNIAKIRNISKGVSGKERTFIRRFQESVLDKQEIDAMNPRLRKYPWEFRDKVIAEMEQSFGAKRAAELIGKANDLADYYKRLFGMSDMDWNIWIRRYHPHIQLEANMKNIPLGARLDWDKFLAMPDSDKLAFFQLLREGTPETILFDDDVFKVAETYTHLMGRQLFTRNTMTKMVDNVKEVIRKFDESGEMPANFRLIISYYKNMIKAVEGIGGDADAAWDYALDNTLDGIYKFLGMKYKGRGKSGVISKLNTLAVGGHLAVRGYPVYKQIMQSLISGGSLIDFQWWGEGLERLLTPGGLKRMRDLGVIKIGQIPSTAMADVESFVRNGGLLGKVINIGMMPFSLFDQLGRGVVYLGMEARVLDALEQFGKKQITKNQFIRKAGMKLFGPEVYNQAADFFNKSNFKGLTDYLSDQAQRTSLYAYEAFEAPTIFRSAIGRLAGQYTSWPINYYNMVKNRLRNIRTAPEGALFLARLGGISAITAATLYEMGINPNEWAPWNNMVMSPGPWFKLGVDMLDALRGRQEGAKEVARTLASIVPFSYASYSVVSAVDALGRGKWEEAFIRLMGAPPRSDLYPEKPERLLQRFGATDIEGLIMKGFNLYYGAKESVQPTNLFQKYLP